MSEFRIQLTSKIALVLLSIGVDYYAADVTGSEELVAKRDKVHNTEPSHYV